MPSTQALTQAPTQDLTQFLPSSTLTSPSKRGRGRPRKVLSPEEEAELLYKQQHKRGRGRPRKVLTPEEQAQLEAELEYKKAHPKERGRPKKEKPLQEEPPIPKKRGRPRKEKPVTPLKEVSPTPRKKPGPKKKTPLTPPDPFADDYFHFPGVAKGGVKKGKYFYPVAYILLRYLPFQSGNPVVLTSNQLLEALGFINPEYSKGRNINAGKETWMYNWFFQKTITIFIPALKRQLEALAKLGVIQYKKTQRIYDSQEEPHLASQEEAEDIEEAELEALDEMGFDSISEVMMKNKSKAFYACATEKLKEFDPKYKDIERYYYCYAIWILKEYEPLTEEEYSKWKRRMNDLIVAMFQKFIDSVYHHSDDRAAEAANRGEDIFSYNQGFVEKQNQFITRFLEI